MVKYNFNFNFRAQSLVLLIKIPPIYNPPDISKVDFVSSLNKFLIELANFSGKILIMGDLNMNWHEKCHNILLLKTLMKQFNLVQVIRESTHVTKTSSTCLDHVYSNDVSINFKSGIFTLTSSDHSGVFIIRKKYCQKVPSKIISTRNFSNIDWDKVRSELKEVNWSDLEKLETADEKLEFFENELLNILN